MSTLSSAGSPASFSHLTVEEMVRLLDLAPHPEGGFYRETWRDASQEGERGHGTAIYFLLPGNVVNRWHRIDAVEIWHYYAGAPLELRVGRSEPSAQETMVLGLDIRANQRPQGIVPKGAWQQAVCLGDWTLVGCTVCPAFLFDGFELIEQ